MRGIFTTILMIFICSAVHAQSFEWAKSLSGTGSGVVRSITSDASGNVYVAGTFLDTMDIDPGPGVMILKSTTKFSQEVFFAKYDAGGNLIWGKAILGDGSKAVTAIAVNALGELYMAGTFSDTVDFDPGPGTAIVQNLQGRTAFYAAKYSNNGDYLWAHGFIVINFFTTQLNSMAIDSSGNIFIAGQFTTTIDFDPGPGVASYTAATGRNMFVAKYDKDGTYLWANVFGGTGLSNNLSSLGVDTAGDVIIGGTFSGTMDFDPGPGTATFASAGTGFEVFVMKYDKNGQYVWGMKAAGGTGNTVKLVRTDIENSIYILGEYSTRLEFGTVQFVGSSDVYILKMSSSGNPLWGKALDINTTTATAVDALGNIYLAGTFYQATDFDPGPGTASPTLIGLSDVYLASYDKDGNYLFVGNMGSTDFGSAFLYAIAPGPANSTVFGGALTRTIDFDFSAASFTLTANDQDGYFVKYSNMVPLSVSLLSFSAIPVNGKTVDVLWKAAWGAGNHYFEIERSMDGKEFTTIGRQSGCDNCNTAQQYKFTDNDPYRGTSYYRLKQVGYDAKVIYSTIARVNLSASHSDYAIYPNPAHSHISIVAVGDMSGIADIWINDITGKQMLLDRPSITKGAKNATINISHLPEGIYTMVIISLDGKASVQKLLIEY